MADTVTTIDVYLEVGTKRTFAGAIDWPGWCRSGSDEHAAPHALAAAGPRYARVLDATPLAFHAPTDAAAFVIIERLTGTATTDFGAPDIAPASDRRPVNAADLQRFETLLQACWQAFDGAVTAAAGKELRKGPRGGGRDVDGIVRHVMGADQGYLARLAWKAQQDEAADLSEELVRTRQAVLRALAAAAQGAVPARGPRGGVIWPPRYFVHRVAWHVLDHAWEIEDRVG